MTNETPNTLDGDMQIDVPGLDNGALGPSDTSDSGSDVAPGMRGRDSDSSGTGERAGVEPIEKQDELDDVETDRIVGEQEAGLAHTPPDPTRNGG